MDGERVRTEEDEETEAINNNGNVSFDITVPETVSSGPATVKVVGSGHRIGTDQHNHRQGGDHRISCREPARLDDNESAALASRPTTWS